MSVTLHTYTKTEYKNAPDHKTTPLNATNLNNSEDGIENAYTDIAAVYKQQQDDLTTVSQTGSTASQAISAGTYFYLDGTLVRAKTAIASGATFTLNTNYEVVSAGGLNAISEWQDITSQCTWANDSYFLTTGSNVKYIKVNKSVRLMHIAFNLNPGVPNGTTLVTVPSTYSLTNQTLLRQIDGSARVGLNFTSNALKLSRSVNAATDDYCVLNIIIPY